MGVSLADRVKQLETQLEIQDSEYQKRFRAVEDLCGRYASEKKLERSVLDLAGIKVATKDADSCNVSTRAESTEMCPTASLCNARLSEVERCLCSIRLAVQEAANNVAMIESQLTWKFETMDRNVKYLDGVIQSILNEPKGVAFEYPGDRANVRLSPDNAYFMRSDSHSVSPTFSLDAEVQSLGGHSLGKDSQGSSGFASSLWSLWADLKRGVNITFEQVESTQEV